MSIRQTSVPARVTAGHMTKVERTTLMTKMIPLTRGKFALVDDEDFEYINAHKWRLDSHGYAVRSVATSNGKQRDVFMAREIMKVPDGIEVDHIEPSQTLDNRKENLRLATRAQNARNQNRRPVNTSGYKGVTWNRGAQKWQAAITVDGKSIYLGVYTDKIDAARAYDAAARQYFGEFARGNFS